MQTGSRNQGADSALGSIVHRIYLPVTSALTAAANTWADFAGGLLDATSLSQAARRLRSMEESAKLYDDRVHRYEEEIRRLRKMLELPETPGKVKTPASVIGYFPLEARATLGVGHDAGVRKGMPVVAAEGLFGIVQTVDRKTSQVLLISSAQLKLVGMVERTPTPVGFIRGLSDGAMAFEVLNAKAVVQNGDLVVTSGFSDRIPAGIPIGRIVQIEEDVAFGTRRCQVFPEVQVGSVREVFVLR